MPIAELAFGPGGVRLALRTRVPSLTLTQAASIVGQRERPGDLAEGYRFKPARLVPLANGYALIVVADGAQQYATSSFCSSNVSFSSSWLRSDDTTNDDIVSISSCFYSGKWRTMP